VARARRLSVEEHAELCAAFLGLSGVQDANSRNLYIEALDNQLVSGLSFARHSDPHHDVWSLLRACQDHRDHPAPIRKLVVIVKAFHRGSAPMARLEELIECLFPDELLRVSERETLLDMLPRVDELRAAAAYRYALPLGSVAPMPDWSDPSAVLDALENHVTPNGRPERLMVFVDYLAHQSEVTTRSALHRWIDEVGFRLALPESTLRDLCVSTEARLAETGRFYLVVQLRPDGIDLDRFLMSVWLQRDNDPQEPLHRDDRAYLLPEAADRLHELIREVPARAGVEVGELTVEFVLPRSLINEPTDQWRMDKVLPHRLGTRHPVVVRSLDRIQDPDLHGPWRSKWRWLTRHGHQADPGAIHWVDLPNERSPESLRAHLLLDDRPVALALAFPPRRSATLLADELTAGLYAGMPVIVWCRDARSPDQFRQEVLRMLSGRGLAELPGTVRRLRLEADHGTDGGDNHLGRHLTVLFDDAERLPEQYRRRGRLRAP
jgi:vWA-MoxR associated protein C-terminal domain/Effector-associated domain 2/vWA-MoxR associated protein middle region 0